MNLEQFIAELKDAGWRGTADAQHEGIAKLHEAIFATKEREQQKRMAMRDYFAGKAMAVFAYEHPPEQAAELAFRYADAMLKAREESK